MTRFRESLGILATSPGRIARKPFSEHLSGLRFAWENDSFDDKFDPEHIRRLVAETRDVYRRGQIVTNAKTLKQLAQALWDDELELANDGRFASSYVMSLESCRSKSPLKSVARQYLFRWPVGERATGIIGDYIRNKASSLTSGWLSLAASNYLFEGERGLSLLAEKMLRSLEGPEDALEETGLRGSNTSGVYAEHVFIKACDLVRKRPDRSSYERLIQFLFYSGDSKGDFRFSSGVAANAFVGAMLGPWKVEPPSADLQRWIIKRVLDAFDDPRLTVGKWEGVDQEYIGLLKRWLAQESLEQFLNIVDQSITDFDKRRMWSYRRPFWTSYFEAGLIQEAWVLFGRDATRIAKAAARENPEFASSYGFLDSTDKSHSVLLMKIGDITIAEWSHNGKCWIWQAGFNAPKLYQKRMTDHACRWAPFSQVHGGAPNYRWQHAVAAELHRLGVPKTPLIKWRP